MDDETDSPSPKKKAPTLYQKRMLWRAITGVSIAVVGALGVGVIILTGKILGFLQPVLVPLAVAGILTYLLDPVVVWVRQKKFFGKDISRLQSIGIVFFLALTGSVFLVLSVVPPMFKQFNKLVDDRATIIEKSQNWADSNLGWLEKYISSEEKAADPTESVPKVEKKKDPEPAADATPVEGPVAAIASEIQNTVAEATDITIGGKSKKRTSATLSSKLQEWLRSDETLNGIVNFLTSAVDGAFGALGYAIGFALVPVYLFFFLKDTSRIRETWKDYVPLKASKFKDEVVSTLQEINGYLIAFFRGQVLVSIIDGVATGIVLTIMGLPYAIVIGVFLAILGIIPFVGIILTWIPAVLIAAAHWGDWQHPLYVTLVFFIVQQVDGLLIQPKVVGDSVGLHPLTVIFSVLFWSLLIGGLLGALLAVPLTAALKVLFQRYVWERRIQPRVMGDRTT
jgi:predicted PurR-regulated permease PerM